MQWSVRVVIVVPYERDMMVAMNIWISKFYNWQDLILGWNETTRKESRTAKYQRREEKYYGKIILELTVEFDSSMRKIVRKINLDR